jgi:hypothetical protein
VPSSWHYESEQPIEVAFSECLGGAGELCDGGILLGKCLDKVMATEVGGSTTAALRACSLDAMDTASLASKLAAEKQKALDKIAKACGVLSQTSRDGRIGGRRSRRVPLSAHESERVIDHESEDRELERAAEPRRRALGFGEETR